MRVENIKDFSMLLLQLSVLEKKANIKNGKSEKF